MTDRQHSDEPVPRRSEPATEPHHTAAHDTAAHDTTGHHTTAWYESLDAVRRVEMDLERHGVDALNITLPDTHPIGKQERNALDDRTARWAASRALAGTLIGVVAGAIVFLLLGLFFFDTPGSLALFSFGGAIFGAFVGFFYGVAVSMPMKPEVYDTFANDPGEPPSHWIRVEGPAPVLEGATEVMNRHQPTRIVTT